MPTRRNRPRPSRPAAADVRCEPLECRQLLSGGLPAPTVYGPGTAASPGPVLATDAPTFTWKAETGVTFTGYQLNVFDETLSKFSSYPIGKSATSYTPTTAIPAGDEVVWNLRLVDGTASGPPSTYLYFEAEPAKPLPAPQVLGPGSATAPGPVLTTDDPTFTWKAVTGVAFTGYQLNVYDETTAKFTSYQVAKSATKFTLPTALPAGDEVVWHLRLVNGTVTGPPGTYLYFEAKPLAPLVAPVVIGPGTTDSTAPVQTTTAPTFTWKAVTGVPFDTYQLNLFDQTTGKFLSFQIASTATSFTPPKGELAAGDTFVWNLRLKRDGVTGPESAYLFFRT